MAVERRDLPKPDPHLHALGAEPGVSGATTNHNLHIPGGAVGSAQGEVSAGYLVPVQHGARHVRTTSSSRLQNWATVVVAETEIEGVKAVRAGTLTWD